MSDIVQNYKNRMEALTDDHKETIRDMSTVGITPEDILCVLRLKFPDLPMLTAQDIANIRPPSGGGSSDAWNLLEKLQEFQSQDSRWFVRWKCDPVTKKLTHLFWMSPRQRDLAEEAYQLLIHDNTYKTNRFKLPAGLFSGVNRHGQTVLLAIALSAKEGTADYVWQYQMWLEATCAAPNVCLTDADPGATAAIAEVFQSTLHLWCLWHIFKNLRENLQSKLGAEYQNFFNAFYHCQKQRSETVFWDEYESLKATYPESASYLDRQLTPNVRYWAGFRHTRFTTGAVSTQRGEGLNRHFKVHLSAQSPLCKLFNEACLREEKEAARLFLSEVRDEMHSTHARTFAISCFPDIVSNMEELLTGYGQSFLMKQITVSGQYGVFEMEDSNLHDEDVLDKRHFMTVDPDVADVPRGQTTIGLIESLPEEQQQDVRIFKVQLRHTVTDKPKNPQFVLLHNKLPGREAYQEHTCTCGDHCRLGVPCRHYWAVLMSCNAATFHRGMVNDLWFKKAQPLGQQKAKLFTFDDPSKAGAPFVFTRPVYPAHPEEVDEAYLATLTVAVSKKRIWGALLGEAKKAIEASIVTGKHDGLLAALRGFSVALPDGFEDVEGTSGDKVKNPDVVKGRGRPAGVTEAKKLRKNTRPPPRERVPLGNRDLNSETAETGGLQAAQGQSSSKPHGQERGEAVAPAAKRAARRCGHCWKNFQQLEYSHDARTCPHKSGATA